MVLSGGPTEVLVDWGHRTTLISSPDSAIAGLRRELDPVPRIGR